MRAGERRLPKVIRSRFHAINSSYHRSFGDYRSNPGVQEYVLIAQDKIHVERYVRQADGTWVLNETNKLEEEIELTSVCCRLPVSEIYFKVTFRTPPR
jgi:Uma2 family endonuclease